jgi:FMN phosphatase YigB (HAD superfamily)
MILNKKKIKAVIFDWGGVCCAEAEPFASKSLQNQLKMSPEKIIEEVRELYDDYYRGKYSTEDFWYTIISHFNLKENSNINPNNLSQAYLDSYELWPEVLEVASRLRNNYTVGLLSDLSPVMRDYIREKHNLSVVFPVQIFSCDKGINLQKKDGGKIFNMMLEKMGAQAEETLFVDNSKNKLKVAEEVGLNILLFENKHKFFNDIKFLL